MIALAEKWLHTFRKSIYCCTPAAVKNTTQFLRPSKWSKPLSHCARREYQHGRETKLELRVMRAKLKKWSKTTFRDKKNLLIPPARSQVFHKCCAVLQLQKTRLSVVAQRITLIQKPTTSTTITTTSITRIALSRDNAAHDGHYTNEENSNTKEKEKKIKKAVLH